MRPSTSSIPRNVIILGIVSFLTDAASEMIYPLVPLFVAALGSGAIALGVIEGVAETTASLLKLASGILSDRLGKRKILILIGYGISSFIRPFTGVVGSAWQIVAIRMIDRVGKGIRSAPRDALIAASVDAGMRGKAFGFHRAMDHAGAVTGPLLAIAALMILLLGFGMTDSLLTLRWTFGLAIIPGLLAVITILFFVKEQPVHHATGTSTPFSLRQFERTYLSYLGIVTLFTLGNSSDAFLLFRAHETMSRSDAFQSFIAGIPFAGEVLSSFGNAVSLQDLSGILFLPVLWSFFHIIKALFSTPLGALSDRIGRKRVIMIGWGIYAIVYVSFAFLDRAPGELQPACTFLLFAVYALYYAFTEGAEKAFVADLVPPGVRGSAFGMYNFAIGAGSLPASILFGFIYQEYGALPAFLTGATIACISMILLGLSFPEKAQSDRNS